MDGTSESITDSLPVHRRPRPGDTCVTSAEQRREADRPWYVLLDFRLEAVGYHPGLAHRTRIWLALQSRDREGAATHQSRDHKGAALQSSTTSRDTGA